MKVVTCPRCESQVVIQKEITTITATRKIFFDQEGKAHFDTLLSESKTVIEPLTCLDCGRTTPCSLTGVGKVLADQIEMLGWSKNKID